MKFHISGYLNVDSGFISACSFNHRTLHLPGSWHGPMRHPSTLPQQKQPRALGVIGTAHEPMRVQRFTCTCLLFGWGWFSSPSSLNKRAVRAWRANQDLAVGRSCNFMQLLNPWGNPEVGKKGICLFFSHKEIHLRGAKTEEYPPDMPRKRLRYNLKKTDYNPTLFKANSCAKQVFLSSQVRQQMNDQNHQLIVFLKKMTD